MPFQRFSSYNRRPSYTNRPFTPPSGPQVARILKSAKEGWYDLSTPYNPGFVSEIKTKLTTSIRSYSPDTRMWSVHESALADAVELLKKYFTEVVNCVGLSQPSKDLVSVFDELFKMIPKEYQDKVYMALAQAVHPDHGGTTENMTKLNKSYGDNRK